MRTRQLLCAFVTIFIYATRFVVAQNGGGDNLGEITFEELKDTKTASRYFAAGGGFLFGSLSINAANINSMLPNAYKLQDFSESLILTGGQGFVAMDFTYNFRVGISSMGGTKTLTRDTSTIKQNLDMTASFNSFTVDYAIPVSKGLTLLPGFQVGFGTFRFERYDGVPAGVKENIPNISNSMRRLETSQFSIQPVLNIEYSISSVAMIRAYGGYNIASSGEWKENRVTTISGFDTKFNSSGIIFGAGVFVGLFRNE